MVRNVYFDGLCQVSSYASFNHQLSDFGVSVNATKKQGRLTVFVLRVNIDSATNQEFCNVGSVVFA